MEEEKLKELLKSLPPRERRMLLLKLREKGETKIEPAETFIIDMTEQPLNKAIVVEVDGVEKTLPPKEAMSLLRAGKAKLVKVIHEQEVV